MSYMALYRKWRPKGFEDVKGQDQIVQTLRNQVKVSRVGHAYLFCGTRGTGKTTVAKIFAKAVNCLNPQAGNPCNECDLCKGINEQTLLNVIEIDAASNNGVDDVRGIRDEVQYSPTEGRYKVYIIDEVHMLTTQAFNALLKTLEEPPAYVIFILATTEAHKLPVTILSRCQRYDFRRITIETISARLHELMEKEQVMVQEKAIRYIAKAADGALRDAISIIDQCISFYIGEELTLEKVLEVVGAVDIEVFSDFLDDILAQNVNGCIARLEDLIIRGKEVGQLIIDFTWYLRNLMIAKAAENPDELLDLTDEKIQVLKNQTKKIDHERLMYFIHVFSELSSQVRYSTQKRVLFEITLIKLCKPEMESNQEALLARMSALEDKLKNGVMIAHKETTIHREDAINLEEEMREEQEKLKERIMALPEDIKKVGQNWSKVVSQTVSPIKEFLRNSTAYYESGNTIVITAKDDLGYHRLSQADTIELLQKAINTMIDGEVTIKIKWKDSVSQNSKETNLINLQEIINIDDLRYE